MSFDLRAFSERLMAKLDATGQRVELEDYPDIDGDDRWRSPASTDLRGRVHDQARRRNLVRAESDNKDCPLIW